MFRSESFQKQLKLISFADVIGRKPTTPNAPNPIDLETTGAAATHNQAVSQNPATNNLAGTHNHQTSQNPSGTTNPTAHNLSSNQLTSPNPATPTNPSPYSPTSPQNLITSSDTTQSLPPTAPSMLATSPTTASQSFPPTSGKNTRCKMSVLWYMSNTFFSCFYA